MSTLPGRTGEAQRIERVYNRVLKSNGSYYTGAGVLVPEFHRGMVRGLRFLPFRTAADAYHCHF